MNMSNIWWLNIKLVDPDHKLIYNLNENLTVGYARY